MYIYIHTPIHIVHTMSPPAHRAIAKGLLPIAYCLFHRIYCLLSLAHCLLPMAYCLLLSLVAYCLSHVARGLGPGDPPPIVFVAMSLEPRALRHELGALSHAP